MKNQMPVESESLGPLVAGPLLIGVVDGVNNESACLVDDFRLTWCDLRVLARYYLAKLRQLDFNWEFEGINGTEESHMLSFAYRRLHSIAGVLGEETFREAIAPIDEKWETRFAEWGDIERKRARCKRCGAFPNIYQPPDYCDNCSKAGSGGKGSKSPES